MIITHKLKMNLEEGELLQRLEMPQGDVSSRQIELLLYAQQKAWTVPEGVTVLIQYRKPDGTSGVYDTMPDGTAAWSAADNVLTLSVAPQVLTVAGVVGLYASLYLDSAVLHTFAVEISVKAPFAGMRLAKSEDYLYATNVLRGPVMAQEGQVLTAGVVDASGRVTAVAALDIATLVQEKSQAVSYTAQSVNEAKKLQARTNIGAASQATVNFLFAKFTQTGIAMPDEKTGETYNLYVSNGKLMLEKEG